MLRLAAGLKGNRKKKEKKKKEKKEEKCKSIYILRAFVPYKSHVISVNF